LLNLDGDFFILRFPVIFSPPRYIGLLKIKTMKRKIIIAASLFVAAIGATSFTKTNTYCNYISAYSCGSGGCGGDIGCHPVYFCTNPAAWPFSDKCYAHQGVPEAPNPCD
jgi:hypothetical protein